MKFYRYDYHWWHYSKYAHHLVEEFDPMTSYVGVWKGIIHYPAHFKTLDECKHFICNPGMEINLDIIWREPQQSLGVLEGIMAIDETFDGGVDIYLFAIYEEESE